MVIIIFLLVCSIAFLGYLVIQLKKRCELFQKQIKDNEKQAYTSLARGHKEQIDKLAQEKEDLLKDIENARSSISKDLEVYKLNEIARIDKELHLRELNRVEEEERKIIEKIQHLNDIWDIFNHEYQIDMNKCSDDLLEFTNIVEDFRLQQEVIADEIMHQKELREKEDFYKVVLTAEDIQDIETLKSFAPKMNNIHLIPELIWNSIILRPTNEMIKRVVGARKISGIYRVTYIPTKEAYIGKSTDIATRWKNHISTAIGREKAATSSFHSHMAEHGIQNYTWEILEEVPKEKLSEREKFYIDFFKTKECGLNQRLG